MMQNIRKTKKQLIEELSALQQQMEETKKTMALFVPEEDVFEVIGSNMQAGTYIIQDDKTHYRGKRAILGNTMDITDKKIAEDELRDIKEKLEIRVQERTSELLATNKVLKENAERLRNLLDNIPDSLVYQLVIEPDGRRHFTHISAGVEQKHGITAEDAIKDAMVLYNQYIEEDRTKLIDAENKALKNMTIFDIEARYRTLKGDLRWAHLRSTPRQLPNGATLWDGLEIDITERKQAEETLRDTETRYRLLFEHSPDGILIIDPVTARPLEFNETAHRQLGYTREGFSNLRIFDLEAAETPEETKSHIAHVMRKGRADFETLQRNRQGEIRNVQVTAQIIEVLGKPVYHCIWRDITNRKRAEEALHKAEWEKAAILDAMSEIVIYLDVDMRIIWSNSGVNRQFNLTPEQVNGNYCYEILHKLNKPCKVCPALKAIETGEPHVIDDFSSYGKRWTLRAYPVRNEREEIVGIVEIVTDITERKRAEEELKESERRCSDIIEFLPDATLVIDKDEKVIAWNRAIEAMTGIKKENMIGKGNHEYSLPFYGDRRPILIDIALHPDKETEKRYTAIQRVGDILFGESFTPNLPPGDIHLSATASVLRDYKGEVTAAIECIRDNTERKRLEERLNRAEKMEGLGRLAGGVAHDLNNILGVLVGYAELLRDKMPADSPLRRYADNIFQSGMRGAAIIQDLLTLARRGVNVSEVVDLNRIVYDYLRTPEFESLKSHQPGVKIWTELEGELLNVKGSPVHLNKTLMNLVSNAVEAISGQGEVMIRTENRYLDHSIRGYDEMQEGDYVILTVSDTGSGISASDLRKIFEPFYTKKVMGRSGTGLGLAVVWGTVKDHNGYIDVQSEEGQGSTFTIYFPVTREEPVKVEKAVSPASYMGKGESILIVDDVKEQRELAMSMLGSLGYQSEAVASGEEAVAYLKKKKADLIVLDMIMEPGMDGMETYRRIIEINHEQKAIIVSGFSETDRVKKAQEIGAGAFVRKPYILEKIGLAVRRELDRK